MSPHLHPQGRRTLLGLFGLLAVLVAALVPATGASAAFQGDPGGKGRQVIIGADDDAPDNAAIQNGAMANQSLRKGDYQNGGLNADLLIGRLGPDVQYGRRGDDVAVGGTERGSDVTAFPPFDLFDGGPGDDVFLWAPGDGSDAIVGGENRRTVFVKKRVTVTRQGGRKVRVTRIVKKQVGDDDVLVNGTILLKDGDITQPALFNSPYGPLPKIVPSGKGLPASLGTNPANGQPLPPLPGFCEVVAAPPGNGYDFLVRFFGENGVQAVTMRTKDVERVLCDTRNSDGITETILDKKTGPRVTTTDFHPKPGSKLDALVD